jgi:hypothetical protein
MGRGGAEAAWTSRDGEGSVNSGIPPEDEAWGGGGGRRGYGAGSSPYRRGSLQTTAAASTRGT